MKLLFSSIALTLMLLFNTQSLSAQNKTVTDTLSVSGNCGQCKTRIDDASYIKGVKHAEWDKNTKLLTVVFNSSKTDINKIAAAVAKCGHDNRIQLATDKDYNKLPECCAYRSGNCHHHE